MLLTTLMLIPLVGSIVVFLLPAAKATLAKQIALGFALATLVGSVLLGDCSTLSPTIGFQLSESLGRLA